ncbi:hypothetical protein ACFPL7_15670 [Dongia soli]|uniref:Uncharacterized protein n=1 Tax=Dongia soli TaxID=600628 RepID=A0ABU5EBD6_9PROT|nr:hypothetical protein [Dongia soli]MDY0883666.1 hypothetical protein [Dongia soli]
MPNDQSLMFHDLAKLVGDNAGSNFASHFDAPIDDPETAEFLQAQAERFTSNGQNFPLSLADNLTVDFGGPNFNEHTFIAPLAPAGNDQFFDALSRRLGTEATESNTGAAFLVNRFVDPVASRRFGAPALRYTEYIVVLQLDLEQGGAIIHTLLPMGLSTIGRKRIPKERELVSDRKQLNQLFPHASSFFKGPPNRILCWNGEKWGSARIRHDSFAETIPNSSSEAAFSPIEHQLVKLTDFEPESFDPRLFRSLAQGLEHNSFMAPNGVEIFGPSTDSVRMYSIIIEKNGEGGDDTTYGTSSGAVIEFSCEGYTSRDACLGCCNSKESAAMAMGTGIGAGMAMVGVGATPLSWPLIIVGAVIVAGSLAIPALMATECRNLCHKQVAGGGGGINTGAGRQHTK